MIRMRIKFIKGETLKFLSHLDILRTYTRALRRSNIPVVYSQGFNVHMIISFALPLSVGNTSQCEFADIDLEEDMDVEDFVGKINLGLPEDLKVLSAEKVDIKSNIMAEVESAKYIVTIYGVDSSNFSEYINELSKMDKILIEKKTKNGIKEVDIKNQIREIKVSANSENSVELYLHLDAGSQSNLKPDLIVDSLKKYFDIQFDDYNVHRIELVY